MNKNQILEVVKMLSKSQGMYCTLLNILEQNEEALEYLEGKNFKDQVDLILFLEG